MGILFNLRAQSGQQHHPADRKAPRLQDLLCSAQICVSTENGVDFGAATKLHSRAGAVLLFYANRFEVLWRHIVFCNFDALAPCVRGSHYHFSALLFAL